MQLKFTVLDATAVTVSFESEEWRSCPGHPRFEISSFGRFRYRASGKIVLPYKGDNGYGKINLTADGKAKNCLSHRLVAEAFLPNPDGLPIVDHIDGDRLNNRVSNLRWASASSNARNSKALRRG